MENFEFIGQGMEMFKGGCGDKGLIFSENGFEKLHLSVIVQLTHDII